MMLLLLSFFCRFSLVKALFPQSFVRRIWLVNLEVCWTVKLLPLQSNKSKEASQRECLIDELRDRLGPWRIGFLYQSGRLILVQAFPGEGFRIMLPVAFVTPQESKHHLFMSCSAISIRWNSLLHWAGLSEVVDHAGVGERAAQQKQLFTHVHTQEHYGCTSEYPLITIHTSKVEDELAKFRIPLLSGLDETWPVLKHQDRNAD